MRRNGRAILDKPGQRGRWPLVTGAPKRPKQRLKVHEGLGDGQWLPG
jgi:hypothetical protein